jgi:lipopolysaccharide export system protein LptC
MNALAVVSDVDDRGPRVFARFGRGDSDRAFRAAIRHSRLVRILRVVIPGAVVLAVVGGVVFSLLLKPLNVLSKLPVDVKGLVVSGTKIMMQQPRIAGFTRDNRRYVLTAQAAGQDITKPDLVELHGINATMEMKDQDTFETTANDGIYNSKTELLTLRENIVVTSASGYRALLSEAVVDIKGGKIVSEKPVQVKTATWTINANRMEVIDSGDVMRFERGVTVVLAQESTASAAGARRR